MRFFPYGLVAERLEPVFLTSSPRKTLQVTFSELRLSGGLPSAHLYYLLLAWHLLVAKKGEFVLSSPGDVCDVGLKI